jgi:hypothetical protein
MLGPSILAGNLAVDENALQQIHRQHQGESTAYLRIVFLF